MHNYTVTRSLSFEDMFLNMRGDLVGMPSTNVGEWQSQKIDMPMKEMLHVVFDMHMPKTQEDAARITGARVPWAEDHFLERVGGVPLNPSPSEAWWPFAKKGETTNADHKSEGNAFSHTYPERMWPRFANQPEYDLAENDPLRDYEPYRDENHGIRFRLGDLQDVVNQLIRSPYTRQAYLPIWFPEDTGAAHGKRVPCTLGYHFMIRDGKLDISYFMRSTDLLRHFQDDVYMAIRLAQWMVERVLSSQIVVGYNFDNPREDPLKVGKLIFHTANLHIFEQDLELIKFWETQGRTWF